MTDLLTLNGIPPQVIGAISAAQLDEIVAYTKDRDSERYYSSYKSCAPAITPFLNSVEQVVNSFTRWGTKRYGLPFETHITFWANDLKPGESTFKEDFNLHADDSDAFSDLADQNIITLRALLTTSAPARFIDMTNRYDMRSLLEGYKMQQGDRVFHQDLLADAENRDCRIIQPAIGEIIIFDAATPHIPTAASEENRRTLVSAWIKFKQPRDWRERVEQGDVPRLASLGPVL